MEINIIFERLLLGMVLATSIGPVSVEVIRLGLDKGFWPAFKVSMGAVVGDSLFLFAFYLGIYHLLTNDIVSLSVGTLGSLYLMVVGVKNLKIKDAALSSSIGKLGFITRLNEVSRGVVLAIFNPLSIMFWFSVFSASFDPANIGISSFLNDLFILVGVVIWYVFLSLLLAIGHIYVNDKMILNINRISGIALILFSLRYLWVNLTKIMGVL
jgi:threonine/homoserine/homoserine lactone efflux protein